MSRISLTCDTCKKDITFPSFVKVGSVSHHKECFKHPACNACKKKIQQGKVFKVLGKEYHSSCFTCKKCTGTLGSTCYQKDAHLFCNNCVDSENRKEAEVAQKKKKEEEAKKNPAATQDPSKCAECSKELSGAVIKALGKRWHKACWVCNKCKNSLPADFHAVEEYPFCDACFGQMYAEKCAKCAKAIIQGSVFRVGDARWHKDCFVCTKCGETATNLQNNKPYCAKC